MKKILVVLLLLTASTVFAQESVHLRAVFSAEEAKSFDKAHPELENPSDYYFIAESLNYSLNKKAEKMLNLIMDKVIAILEEESDTDSKEE